MRSTVLAQDLSELLREEGPIGACSVSEGVCNASNEDSSISHLAAARGMPLALAALHGILRHLELLRNPSNLHTFSLTMGEELSMHMI